MDLPGHPDDYGVDAPTLLMDSDALLMMFPSVRGELRSTNAAHERCASPGRARESPCWSIGRLAR